MTISLSREKLARLRVIQQLDEALSEKERPIVECAITLEGLTAKAIAIYLNLSYHTVETHIKQIRAKASQFYHQNVTFGFIIAELKCYYFCCREGM